MTPIVAAILLHDELHCRPEWQTNGVHVKANDYAYVGTLVSIFRKTSAQIRCVVEDDCGRLFIHNPDQVSTRA